MNFWDTVVCPNSPNTLEKKVPKTFGLGQPPPPFLPKVPICGAQKVDHKFSKIKRFKELFVELYLKVHLYNLVIGMTNLVLSRTNSSQTRKRKLNKIKQGVDIPRPCKS